MKLVSKNRFITETDSNKPARKWNRFNKKMVLEPVYETDLPGLIFLFCCINKLNKLIVKFQFPFKFKFGSNSVLNLGNLFLILTVKGRLEILN
jgi:hypothetical protein